MTLNSFYEGNEVSRMISDDRLITATLDRWVFGDDDTGDVLEPANRASMLRRISGEFDRGMDLGRKEGLTGHRMLDDLGWSRKWKIRRFGVVTK